MDLYARVKDGKIVEYPVYLEHIKARGLPESWFVKCEIEPQPTTDIFSYAVQEPRVVNSTQVVVGWKVSALGLEQLLSRLPLNPDSPKNNRRPNRRVVNEQPSEAMVAKIKTMVEDRVQALLDSFALTRGYATLERAVSYIGDKNVKWNAEGIFCRDLRSDTWTQLQVYFTEVTATPQVKPWPNTWQDIANNLPKLQWPAEAPVVEVAP